MGDRQGVTMPPKETKRSVKKLPYLSNDLKEEVKASLTKNGRYKTDLDRRRALYERYKKQKNYFGQYNETKPKAEEDHYSDFQKPVHKQEAPRIIPRGGHPDEPLRDEEPDHPPVLPEEPPKKKEPKKKEQKKEEQKKRDKWETVKV